MPIELQLFRCNIMVQLELLFFNYKQIWNKFYDGFNDVLIKIGTRSNCSSSKIDKIPLKKFYFIDNIFSKYLGNNILIISAG